MGKEQGNISEVIAPLLVIAIEFDAIIGTLLREQFAMSLADFKILRAIHMLGGACSQLDIARFNHVTEAAISKRITALAGSGLIEKYADAQDKRKSLLSLTKQGKVLMQKLQTAIIINTEGMLGTFSKANRKHTTKLLLEILELIISHSPRKEMLLKSKHPVLSHLIGRSINEN